MDTNPENRPKPPINYYSLVWAIMWLVLGLAMIIWPDAHNIWPGYTCDPDEVFGCFLATSWGTPAGIVISLTIGFLTGLSAIRKRRNKDDE